MRRKRAQEEQEVLSSNTNVALQQQQQDQEQQQQSSKRQKLSHDTNNNNKNNNQKAPSNNNHSNNNTSANDHCAEDQNLLNFIRYSSNNRFPTGSLFRNLQQQQQQHNNNKNRNTSAATTTTTITTPPPPPSSSSSTPPPLTATATPAATSTSTTSSSSTTTTTTTPTSNNNNNDNNSHSTDSVVVIQDEMYVYELKCIMHQTNALANHKNNYFNSVLLFSFYDLQRPFPFCPFHVHDLMERTDLQQRGTFISPVFLFKVDMNESDIRCLMNWYESELLAVNNNTSSSSAAAASSDNHGSNNHKSGSCSRREYAMISNSVVNQDISGRFLLFPMRDASLLSSKLTEQTQQVAREQDGGNFSFDQLFQCMKSMMSVHRRDHDMTCTDTLSTFVQDQLNISKISLSSLSSYMLEKKVVSSDYTTLSLMFEDCVFVHKKTNKLYLVEFLDLFLSSKTNWLAGCSEVKYISSVSTLRHSNKDYLATYLRAILAGDKKRRNGLEKIHNDGIVMIPCDQLYCTPFASGVMKIMERRNFIQEFNESIVRHLKSLQTLEQKLQIQFENPFLLRQCLMHDSFALFHGNRFIGNERLEFLGDSVLDVANAIYFYSKDYQDTEKRMSKLVTNNNLATLGKAIGLESYMMSAITITQKHIADAVEALTGAIFIDRKGDLNSVLDFCEKVIFKESVRKIRTSGSSVTPDDKKILMLQQFLNYQFKSKSIVSRCLYRSEVSMDRNNVYRVGRAIVKLVLALHVFCRPTVSLVIGSLTIQREEIMKKLNHVKLFPHQLGVVVQNKKHLLFIIVGLLFIDGGLTVFNNGTECDVGDRFIHKIFTLEGREALSTTSKPTPTPIDTPDDHVDLSTFKDSLSRRYSASSKQLATVQNKIDTLQKRIASALSSNSKRGQTMAHLEEVLRLLSNKADDELIATKVLKGVSGINTWVKKTTTNTTQIPVSSSQEGNAILISDEESDENEAEE